MKWPLILSLAFGPAAPADDSPLTFSAKIRSEALAEEAIDLLHCLAGRRGGSWELGDENAGPPSVRLVEKDGKLSGRYRTELASRDFLLEKNGWRRACEKLEPMRGLALAEPETPPAFAGAEAPRAEARPSRTWLWVAIGGAVLTTGFLLLKGSRADHRSLRMD